MTVPPAAKGRKQRLVRRDAPDDLLLVIRATPASRALAVEKIAEDAELSARIYLVELRQGERQLLYGVSVFAHRAGHELTEVLDRFPFAPMFIEAPVGVIRSAGCDVIATGENPDHFDVQLIPGVGERDAPPSRRELRAAAAQLLDAAGELRPNPSYAGGADDQSEVNE